MQLTKIRVHQRADEWECLLWGINSRVRETVGDNRGGENKNNQKTKNVGERKGL